MAHDTHFLSRLERVQPSHVELALSLYRDRVLLQELFQRVELGAEVERVAIALDAGEDAPHLVVARNGHFVTCLGPGMSVGELPIISKARLDAAASHIAELRARLQAATAATGAREEELIRHLLRDLMTKSEALSRETMAGLVGLRPMIGRTLAAVRGEVQEEIDALRLEAFARHRLPDDEVVRYRRLLWAGLHADFVLLQAPGFLDAIPWERPDQHALFGFSLTQEGPWLAGLVRATWLAALHSEALLGPYKRSVRTAVRFHLDTLLTGLIAMGLRHQKLMAEVSKVFQGGDKRLQLGRDLVSMLPQTHAAIKKMAWDNLGAAWRAEGIGGAEELPLDLAFAYAAMGTEDPFGNQKMRAVSMLFAPMGARLRPEELYLPLRILDRMPPVDAAAEGRALLARYVDFHRQETVKAAATPGRNEPCSCGSGKKYKRCHGA